MSSFKVEVFKPVLEPHPNADRLSIVRFKGWVCVCNTADFAGSDLAAYVPLDAVVPDTPEWAFLQGHRRIKTCKLRGVVSQGVLIPGKDHPGWKVGDDVAAECGIVKYEEPEPLEKGGMFVREPAVFIHYTDVENYKNHPGIFQPGEEVVVLEKLHGTNWRAGWVDGVFHVGSHKNCMARDEKNLYWKAAIRYEVEAKLKELYGTNGDQMLHGEAIGVQDLKYGHNTGQPGLAIFDFSQNSRFHDWDGVEHICKIMGLPTVPVLYRGPFDEAKILGLAEGKTTVGGVDHVREGVVVRPVKERWNDAIGRVILKVVGVGYSTRKGGTEHH